MLLRRIDNAFPIHRMGDALDQLFSDLTGGTALARPCAAAQRHGLPALNIWEDEQNVFVEIDVPGLTMDDLEVSLLGGELTIKGSKQPRGEEKEGVRYYRQERRITEFARKIELPADVAPDSVSASLTHGVLAITLPKSEATKPRKIEVQAG